LSKNQIALGIEATKEFLEDLSLDIPSAEKDYGELVGQINESFN